MQQLTVFVKIGFGVFAASAGILLLILKSLILDFIADSVLILNPESGIKNIWLKAPELIPTDIYFFNWTNPQDVHNLSIKPKFEQCGPYRYQQDMEKINVVWNENNDTVTYNQIRYWYFDEEHTNGSLADELTTVNIMAVSLAHRIRNWDYFIKSGMSLYFSANSYQIHFTKTADEFLNGFEDILLDLSRFFPFIVDDIPRIDKFGVVSLKNATNIFDGTFNVANGRSGNFDLLNWNYNNVTPYSSACTKVSGSTGELYSRAATRDYVDIFIPDLCRPLRFDFEEEVVVHGITGYKYSIGLSTLDNGTLVQGNECFCDGDCIPSGMINISSCRYGLPYYPSLPHFYGGDPVYLDGVEGLHPEKQKHETYVVLEPKTMILLMATVRFQMNALLHPIEGIRLYENVRKTFIPLAWVQQTAVLPYTQRVFLKIFLVSGDVITGISILLICLGLYIVLYIMFKSKFLAVFGKICKKRQPILRQIIIPEEIPLKQEEKLNAMNCNR